MSREPATILALPGVYALINRKRRFAYVAYTANLQKRSHSMSHMLMSHDEDKKTYWPIKDLPKHPSGEFTFLVVSTEVKPAAARAGIALAQKAFVAKNYRIIDGFRAASPMVTVAGKAMSLAEAVRDHSKVKYLTAYRRIERGWTTRQALGLDPPAPRWDHDQQAARRRRAENEVVV
jgi:hypothetical protein